LCFGGTRLEEFFKANRAILPPDASRENVNVSRDVNNRTVTIVFDLRLGRTTRIEEFSCAVAAFLVIRQ